MNLSIQLNEANKVGDDWTEALFMVADEFETIINPILVSIGKEPITVHTDRQVAIESVLGASNTPPTNHENPEYDGLVDAIVTNYTFINSRFFEVLSEQAGFKIPSTFWLCAGDASPVVFA